MRKRLLKLIAVRLRHGSEFVESLLQDDESRKVLAEEKPDDVIGTRQKGPPDHWVELVREHAPELLHPVEQPQYTGMEEDSAVAYSEMKERKAMAPKESGTAEEAFQGKEYGRSVSNRQIFPVGTEYAVDEAYSENPDHDRKNTELMPGASGVSETTPGMAKKKQPLFSTTKTEPATPSAIGSESATSNMSDPQDGKLPGECAVASISESERDSTGVIREGKPTSAYNGAGTVETKGGVPASLAETKGQPNQTDRKASADDRIIEKPMERETGNSWSEQQTAPDLGSRKDAGGDTQGTPSPAQSLQAPLVRGQPDEAVEVRPVRDLSSEGQHPLNAVGRWPELSDEMSGGLRINRRLNQWPELPKELVADESMSDMLWAADHQAKLSREQKGDAWNGLPF